MMRKAESYEAWLRESYESWLEKGEAPADLLTELQTEDNTLSVWSVEDIDQARCVLALMELNRCKAHSGNLKGQSLRDGILITFDLEVLKALGIELKESAGPTADTATNDRHRDMVDLTASKVAVLARELLKSAMPQTVPKEDMLDCLEKLEHDGRLPAAAIPERVRAQLASKSAPPSA